MAEFGSRVDAFLDEFFAMQPVAATATGMHAHDAEWPDLSARGREKRVEFIDRWEGEFRATAAEGLTPDELVDRDLLLAELESIRFEIEELREEEWDALGYVYLLGGGIFPLLAREFAPLADRLTSIAGRLEGLPAVLDAARGLLGAPGERLPSRFHAETAIRQLDGITGLADEAVEQARSGGVSDAAVAGVIPRLERAASAVHEEIEAFRAFLQDELLPRAEGEGRLGSDLFDRKLRHTFKTDLTAEEIEAQAQREFVAIRTEMIRLAREMWPAWVPDRPLPTVESEGSQDAADQRTVRDVLGAIGRVHQAPDALLDFCRAEHDRIVAFCRSTGLITVPNEPLEIIWTPPFLREFAGAMLDSPGPLDKGEKTFFCITPTPDDWTAAQVESYLAEDNDRMLRLLTIHEATPGHYLQGVYANRCPSIARAVFWSGVFAEGWAVYVTQVMMDAGYGAEDPALMLTHWKFYLRAVTNALMDVRIHAGSMTQDEAMELMVNGGFQEDSEARKKWDRARLTSTQLSTYFVGSMEMWDLEREARRRAAEAAGAGESAVPAPRIVGGFGETPGFDHRRYLEGVLSHGTPPIPFLRRMVLR